jgi:ribonuclease PH
MSFKRPSGRTPLQLRHVTITPHVSKHAYGSCLIRFGDAHVLCTASLDDNLPRFLRNKGTGWVTAEYSMLPGATSKRTQREAVFGKQGGRTVEIQRLIGRSMRSVTNMKALGERQLVIDCDVLQADGGTRTASITGGYVALHLACQRLIDEGLIVTMPLTHMVAAVSCGICQGTPVLDLDYLEDSNADVDANFVMTSNQGIVEVQGTAEKEPFSQQHLTDMMMLAQTGIQELHQHQLRAIA